MAEQGYRECPFCGEDIKQQAIKCKHCQSMLYENHNKPQPILQEKSNIPQTQQNTQRTMLTAGWIIASVLLPIVGIVAGIVRLVNGRQGAGALIGISVAVWFVFFLLLL
jgi:uncharacterized membrane protein YvbJ